MGLWGAGGWGQHLGVIALASIEGVQVCHMRGALAGVGVLWVIWVVGRWVRGVWGVLRVWVVGRGGWGRRDGGGHRGHWAWVLAWVAGGEVHRRGVGGGGCAGVAGGGGPRGKLGVSLGWHLPVCGVLRVAGGQLGAEPHGVTVDDDGLCDGKYGLWSTLSGKRWSTDGL